MISFRTTGMHLLFLVSITTLPFMAIAFLQPTTKAFTRTAVSCKPLLWNQARLSLTHGMSLQDEDMETEGKSSSGVVEIGDDEEEKERKTPQQSLSAGEPPRQVAPFLSQGEIDPNTTNVDFSDPQQTRVIIYMILSLLPVLFLIPFMLSREFIPVEYLPPVNL